MPHLIQDTLGNQEGNDCRKDIADRLRGLNARQPEDARQDKEHRQEADALAKQRHNRRTEIVACGLLEHTRHCDLRRERNHARL